MEMIFADKAGSAAGAAVLRRSGGIAADSVVFGQSIHAALARVISLGSPRKARCAALCLRPPAFRSRPPADLDERAIEQGVKGGPGDCGADARAPRKPAPSGDVGPGIVVGCDQTLALGERRILQTRGPCRGARSAPAHARQAA